MAFGHIRRKRKKQQKAQAAKAQKQEQYKQELASTNDPAQYTEDYQRFQEAANKADAADEQRRSEQREKFGEEALEDVNRPMQGLSPQEKTALQESANAQINKQVQKYSRQMGSQAGQRGIRGGAGAAPQQELGIQAMEAQNQFQRDLADKDTDLKFKRLAAYLAGKEGRTAEDLIRRQQGVDWLSSQRERRRQDLQSNRWNELMGF
jgi:hypothetical protein